MDIDSLLEPDDYDDIEEKQKTVSKEVFQTIYDKVWKWYQEIKQKNKLWDDQDLGRYILENNLARPSFPGIFCDEAQDFTRVEMELLFRLSFYSDKDIQKQDISQIPFAFAGDEFQTLNPTGFRWEALKAGFTQKFLLSLSTGAKGSVTTNLNYRVLENNYRSLPRIVQFCNTLQLFRAVRFDISGLRPQKYWKSNPIISVSVASFYSDEAEFWEKIQNDAVFIIPCDEGQEVEWIQKDKELSRYITIENDAPSNMQVLSANLAKGLEFNRVVVYGFGSSCPEKMIDNYDDDEDTSVTLPLEYYINKTYVAISRAKKQLFIVDTREGMNKLWDVTISQERVNSYLEKINEGNTKNWSMDNDLFLLMPGFSSLMENVETNHEETASQLRQKGISDRQPYVLRLAANSYRSLGKNNDADQCEATAYLFDKKYIQAGTNFADSGYRSEAIKAFWLANSHEGYEKIIQKAEQYPDFKFMYSIALAMIKNDKSVLVDAINIISETSNDKLYKILKGDEIFPDYDLRSILPDAVNKIVQKISAHIDPSTDELLLHHIIDISKRGLKIPPEYIAEIAYTLNEHEKAVSYWDKSETKDSEKYTNAKALCTKFPENLPLLKSIKRYDEVISQFNSNRGKKLSEDQLCIVAEAFLTQQDTENALQICAQLTSSGSFTQLAKCYAGSDKAIQNIFFILAGISEIREENWDVIKSLLFARKEAKNTNLPTAFYFAAAIGRFDLYKLPVPGSSLTQKEISEFLREEVIKKSLIVPDELVIDIGTSVEKAGHRLDALEYYKLAETNVKTSELRHKCAERWIKAKERQAENTPKNDNVTREKRINEAVNKRRLHDIPEKEELPEYETLLEWADLYHFVIKNEKVFTEKPIPGSKRSGQKLKVVAVEKPPVENDVSENSQPQRAIEEFEMNGYRFTYYHRQRRLNITNMAEGKGISIMQNNQASTDYTVEEVSLPDGQYKSVKDTPILFQNADKIRVKFSDMGLTFEFDD
jgi:hypothetical protein